MEEKTEKYRELRKPKSGSQNKGRLIKKFNKINQGRQNSFINNIRKQRGKSTTEKIELNNHKEI